MFELLVVSLFVCLLGKAAGLVLSLTWGAVKITAGLIMLLALPALILGMLFLSGMVLLIPVAMLCVTIGIVKVSSI